MELLLAVAYPDATRDVRVTVDGSALVGELGEALVAYAPAAVGAPTLYRGDQHQALEPTATIADAGLVSGDVLRFAPRSGASVESGADVRLAVTAGHSAGESIRLSAEPQWVGRAVECALAVADPQVSSKQFSITDLGGGRAWVVPHPERRNTVRLNGVDRNDEFEVGPDDSIAAGQTSFAVRVRRPTEPLSRDSSGTVAFTRTPEFRRAVPAIALPALAVPTRPTRRRFNFISAVSPLLLGVGMALALGNSRFLLFACMSPVIAIANYVDQRWVSGKEYRDDVARFQADLEQRRSEVGTALREERIARFANSPDVEELAFRARHQLKELWNRGRSSEDFLRLRIGVGSVPPALSIDEARDGEPEHLEALWRAEQAAQNLLDVPVLAPLAELGTVALVGSRSDTTQLASALALQVVCLHSPEDLIMLGAVAKDSGMHAWLSWLPHARSPNSPLDGQHLPRDAHGAGELLGKVAEIAEGRLSTAEQKLDRRWPWLFVLLDVDAAPDPGVVARLLDAGIRAGVTVLWMCSDERQVPRQASMVVRCSDSPTMPSVVSYVDAARPAHDIDIERASHLIARQTALALASLRDASASNAASAIPTLVPLLDAFGTDSIDAGWVAARWAESLGDYSLKSPVGMGEAGPFEIDLVQHGPHGLIGGTSGAGKSELLQSLLAGLVAHNPPDRLNLLFIDYKGGALSKKFDSLPHTVGSVTNLDSLLAQRALTSLIAELNYRMGLFGSSDMRKMVEIGDPTAPASLVIVVDEFAALVRELPEFVDGIVSIAERGRSLGIHLLLSTQRPSGSINDSIQQNTNLRVALRMLDSGESNNVIGTSDAALIPNPLKGRALARLGAGQLIPFQSAWSEAPLVTGKDRRITVRPFATTTGDEERSHGAASMPEGSTKQLDAVVQAVGDVGAKRGRSPWRDPLPRILPLGLVAGSAVERADVGRAVSYGFLDDPAAQDQYATHVDLRRGAFAILGTSASGKTTALQTLAASAAIADADAGGVGLEIIGLDFASRMLDPIAALPQVSEVAAGDDLEALTRVLAVLDAELSRRRGGTDPSSLSPILLLIDGWHNATATLGQAGVGSIELQPWFETLVGIIGRGREVGIYTAMSSLERPRSRIMNSIASKLVLRQLGDAEYRDLGVPSTLAAGLELGPGQGLDDSGRLVQVATLDTTGTGDAELPLAALAKAMQSKVPPIAVQAQRLPPDIVAPGKPANGKLVAVGVADLSSEVVCVDLADRHVGIAGPPRSGRSNLLGVMATQLQAGGHRVAVMGPPTSPLASQRWDRACFAAIDEIGSFAASAVEEVDVVLIDDLDLLDGRELFEPFEKLLKDPGVAIIAVVDSFRRGGINPLVSALKAGRTSFLMQTSSREVADLRDIRGAVRPGLDMPPGRCVLIANRQAQVVQSYRSPDNREQQGETENG